jgi:glycosyltransferase involved in cell wall biosynthesis
MKVTHVIARLNIGGPAVHVGLVCAGLRQRGHHARLIAGRVAPPEGDMEYACSERGVSPIYAERLGRSLDPLADAASLAFLVRQFREHRPDVVHTHTSKAGALGRIAARLAGVPAVVHTYHGHVLHGYFGWAANLAVKSVERALALLTDTVVVLGESQKRELAELRICRPDRIRAIPFGMELTPFVEARALRSAARAELGLPADCEAIGIVGRLTAIKGHEHFLEMARRLAARRPRVRFLIVGDGELRHELEASVHLSGLSDRTLFLGWRKELPPVYAAMDVLALTSLNEGSPVVLKEAMAAGVPCVAHRVGGVPDLIEPGVTGFLVEPGDAEALAGAVERCLAGGKALGEMLERARARMLERHGHEAMVDALEQLYTELLARSGRG